MTLICINLHCFYCISIVNLQQYIFTEALQGFQIRNQVKNHHYCSASLFWCIRQFRGQQEWEHDVIAQRVVLTLA